MAYFVDQIMTEKENYRKFWSRVQEPELYNSPWWLDTVCGSGGWDVIKSEGIASGYLPYYPTRLGRLKAILTPPMTQRIGMLTDFDGTIQLADLLKELPSTSILKLAIDPGIGTENLMKEYKISTRYTYVIRYRGELEDIRSGYSEGLRRNLKEAKELYEVMNSEDIATLLHLVKSSFTGNYPYLEKLLPFIAKSLLERKVGNLKIALEEGKPIAGILTGRDSRNTYYLAGGRIQDPKAASAHALLLDTVMEEAFRNRTTFDFEGSMQPGIANFFQSFGAEPFAFREVSRYSGLGKVWELFH